jgi:hypothetical protein
MSGFRQVTLLLWQIEEWLASNINIASMERSRLSLSVADRFGSLEGILFAYEPKPIKGNPRKYATQ